MRERIEQRLHELRVEFQAGQKLLAELEAKQANVKSSLLRISGAIQVLEEVLEQPQDGHNGASVPAASREATPSATVG